MRTVTWVDVRNSDLVPSGRTIRPARRRRSVDARLAVPSGVRWESARVLGEMHHQRTRITISEVRQALQRCDSARGIRPPSADRVPPFDPRRGSGPSPIGGSIRQACRVSLVRHDRCRVVRLRMRAARPVATPGIAAKVPAGGPARGLEVAVAHGPGRPPARLRDLVDRYRWRPVAGGRGTGVDRQASASGVREVAQGGVPGGHLSERSSRALRVTTLPDGLDDRDRERGPWSSVELAQGVRDRRLSEGRDGVTEQPQPVPRGGGTRVLEQRRDLRDHGRFVTSPKNVHGWRLAGRQGGSQDDREQLASLLSP